MAIIDVKVPQLSESVSEATLLNWHKQVGEAVAEGENLIDVETDKVVLELPASQKRRAEQDHQGRWRKSRQRRTDCADRHGSDSRQTGSSAGRCRRRAAFGAQAGAGTRGRCRQPARQRTQRARHQGRRAECDAAGCAGGGACQRAEGCAASRAGDRAVRQPSRTARRDDAHPPAHRRAPAAIAAERRDPDHLQRSQHAAGDRAAQPLQGCVREEARRQARFLVVLRQGGGAGVAEIPDRQRLGGRQRHHLPRLFRHRHGDRQRARPGRADHPRRGQAVVRRHRKTDRRFRRAAPRSAS